MPVWCQGIARVLGWAQGLGSAAVLYCWTGHPCTVLATSSSWEPSRGLVSRPRSESPPLVLRNSPGCLSCTHIGTLPRAGMSTGASVPFLKVPPRLCSGSNLLVAHTSWDPPRCQMQRSHLGGVCVCARTHMEEEDGRLIYWPKYRHRSCGLSACLIAHLRDICAAVWQSTELRENTLQFLLQPTFVLAQNRTVPRLRHVWWLSPGSSPLAWLKPAGWPGIMRARLCHRAWPVRIREVERSELC